PAALTRSGRPRRCPLCPSGNSKLDYVHGRAGVSALRCVNRRSRITESLPSAGATRPSVGKRCDVARTLSRGRILLPESTEGPNRPAGYGCNALRDATAARLIALIGRLS